MRTRPALDIAAMRARSDAVGLLVRELDNATSGHFAAEVQTYCATLLNRARLLREALGEDHPAVQAAGGALSPGPAGKRPQPAARAAGGGADGQMGLRVLQARRAKLLPLPLREGVGGRGAYSRRPRLHAPLPPTPSLKGRGRCRAEE